MTAQLFHIVEPLLYRRWVPMFGFSNTINYIYKREYSRSTVDPKDFFQGNKIELASFWDPEGTFKALHTFNCLRVPYIRDGLVEVTPGDKLSTCLKGKKILDVGCGPGLLSEALAKLGADVTGIDANKHLISQAIDHSCKNKRLANNSPTYIFTTIEEHSNDFTEKYDAIVCSEVIEHVTQKELFVESCVRTTKPGGKLFFTTPNRTRFAQFYLIFFFENILRNYPKGAHHFKKFMRPNELKFMLEMNDCSVESIRGYFYYPGNYNWEWTNTKMFSFAIEAVKSSF